MKTKNLFWRTMDYVAPYNSCVAHDWFYWALAIGAFAIVVGGMYVCATSPGMCGEIL